MVNFADRMANIKASDIRELVSNSVLFSHSALWVPLTSFSLQKRMTAFSMLALVFTSQN